MAARRLERACWSILTVWLQATLLRVTDPRSGRSSQNATMLGDSSARGSKTFAVGLGVHRLVSANRCSNVRIALYELCVLESLRLCVEFRLNA